MDTRHTKGATRRRRVCTKCGKRYTTYESLGEGGEDFRKIYRKKFGDFLKRAMEELDR